MSHNAWASQFTRWVWLGVLILLGMVVNSRCTSGVSYSLAEQRCLRATRMPQMENKLTFSFRLTPGQVPVGQDIFFVATFTNTTDQPLVLREPRQRGVLEIIDPDTTLFFNVEAISTSVPFSYPLDGYPFRVVTTPIERDEFVTLPPHGTREVRLKLPNLVIPKGADDACFLPPGEYLIHMTYDNLYIGYELDLKAEWRYVDLKAWMGEVEADPVPLTITPSELVRETSL
jgi:hypothetical protein